MRTIYIYICIYAYSVRVSIKAHVAFTVYVYVFLCLKMRNMLLLVKLCFSFFIQGLWLRKMQFFSEKFRHFFHVSSWKNTEFSEFQKNAKVELLERKRGTKMQSAGIRGPRSGLLKEQHTFICLCCPLPAVESNKDIYVYRCVTTCPTTYTLTCITTCNTTWKKTLRVTLRYV